MSFSFDCNQLWTYLYFNFTFHNLHERHCSIFWCSFLERTLSKNLVFCADCSVNWYFHLNMAFSMSFVFCICFELAASIEFDFLTILFADLLFNMDSSNPSSNTLDLRVFGFIFSETGHFDIFPMTITDVCARVIMKSYVLSQDFSFGLKYFFHFYNCEYHGVSALQLYSRDTFYLRTSRFSFSIMIRFEKIFAFQLKDYYNF